MQNRIAKSWSGRLVTAGVLGFTLTCVTLAAMAAQGAWRTYLADDPVGRDVVMIESQAPLETMLTRTNKIKGEIKLNESDILQSPQAACCWLLPSPINGSVSPSPADSAWN